MRAWVRQSREEGRRRGEERLENLGQTASEPRLKRWRKCTQPVGIQYQGSRPMSRGTSGWWGGGGGRKVCQLHNDTPPDLRAEETSTRTSGFLSVSEEKAPKTQANCSHITTFKELTENTTYTPCHFKLLGLRGSFHHSDHTLPPVTAGPTRFLLRTSPRSRRTAASDTLHYLLLSAEHC